VASALLVAVAVLGGCSTGDDEGSATTTTATRSGTSATTEPPDYEGDPDSPFCTLLRDVDTTSILAGDADDPASVEAALARLVEVLADASETAPPDIVEDVALVAGGVAALDEALAAVGYDFEALAASDAGAEVMAAANDPVFADAGTRLAAYRTQVCEL
jgi:hypothetical protein